MSSTTRRRLVAGAVFAAGTSSVRDATTEPPAAEGPTSAAGGTIDFAATTEVIEITDDQLAALEGEAT